MSCSEAQTVLVYALVSARTEKAVDVFVRRRDAEAEVANVDRDDGELARTLRIEIVDLDRQSSVR